MPSDKTQNNTSQLRFDVDRKTSDKTGFLGAFEQILRSFKHLSHVLVLIPVLGFGCSVVGLAVTPALLFTRWVYQNTHSWNFILKFWVLATTLVASFWIFGLSLLFIIPTVNALLRLKLTPWKGPYYSLETIRWYLHNGLTYIVRYTILEFLTPTPLSNMFYKMMGMKIGKGVTINTTNISDPSLIKLGDRVTIGGSVTLVAHYGQGGVLVLNPVQIGNNVTIGLRAIIMGGVEIGDGAKILPNSSVLPKTKIPAGETWGGIPAVKMNLRSVDHDQTTKLAA